MSIEKSGTDLVTQSLTPWGLGNLNETETNALRTLHTHQSSEGRRRPRLAENPTIKPTSKTPEPARNHLIY